MFIRGAIGFSTHRNKKLSRIIRWFTGHRYSHSFIVAEAIGSRKEAEPQRVYLLDAYKREVSFSSAKTYEGDDTEYEIWWPKDVLPATIDAALSKTEDLYVKQPYSYARLLGIGIRMFLQKKFGWVIKNPLPLGTICSEVTWFYLNELFPGTFGHLDRLNVSPEDLWTHVRASEQFEKIRYKPFK
jgi:hypothetical protein